MGDCLMITGTTGVAKPVGVIGGSGHDIINASGTAMAQEDGLQFASGCVEDDPVNGKTIYIEMIRISQANYNTLKANGQLKPGAKYFIYDAQPVAVNASNLPYSSTQSTKQKIDEVEESIGEWSQGELLQSETWGGLYGSYNEKCKLAVLRWIGNSTSATAGTKEYSLPAHYKPAFAMFSVMHNSTSMEVNPQTEKISMQFTANNWVSGGMIYPTK